jgi:NTP pyrophosphatase (non-canonical NTP hydrolase)
MDPENHHDHLYANLSYIAQRMYDIAKALGFHDSDVRGTVPENFGDWCANLHSEVSELWEAYRKQRLAMECDKHNGMTCAEEELADIVIRAMDTAVALGVDIGSAVQRKAEYNKTRPYRNGGKIA